MKKLNRLIGRYPLIAFFVLLAVLFAVIFAGNKMRTAPEDDTQMERPVKAVDVFNVEESVIAPVTAEVDRTDTITLYATASGIVSRALWDGQTVYRGSEIVKLADAYSGANAADAAVAIAARDAQFQDETFEDGYKNLTDQKNDVGRTSSTTNKIERRQLSIQKRALEAQQDVSHLQVAQAAANAARYRITAPFSGRVEEVFVRIGDQVTAGQPIAIVKATGKDEVYIVAHVGAARASQIDVNAPIVALYNGVETPLKIINIANSNSSSQSYALTFEASVAQMPEIADGEFIEVRLPMGDENDFLIPLDAVRYSASSPEVYVIEDGRAVVKFVALGDVVGSYVIIQEGLGKKDSIILDRTVSDGEEVVAK